MALIKNGTVGTEAPLLAYYLYAEQTGASGTSRTIKITVEFKVNGGSNWWYGYSANWRARVHNSYGGWSQFKGTESWNGGQSYRSYSQTLTVDVGTTNSTSITVGFDSSSGDNGWNGSVTGSFTVGSTNVPPVLSGTVTTSPSGIIPENTASVVVTSPIASDTNLSGYRCRVSINSGGYTEIYRGDSRQFTHTISNYGEGTTFKYCFDAYDSVGAWSGVIYSDTITKNRFTGDTLSSSSGIYFDEGNTTITFTYSGANNTNGNNVITRSLSCEGIPIYNPTITSSPITLTIYRSGDYPSTPYIMFDDLKNRLASSSYKGNLSFTLNSTNYYGTPRTSTKSIVANLQTNPNAVRTCGIATDSNSTAYRTVASTGNKYFLPDGSLVIRVNWEAGSGKLGEEIKHELFVAYGSGGWSKVKDLSASETYYDHPVPRQSVSQSIRYKVRVSTSYGTYADNDTSAQTLHFYNTPSLTIGTITRGATTCDVQVTIKSQSSIPNINTVGTWDCLIKDSTTSVKKGTLTVAQTVQTISVTGLTDEGQYDLKVTFKDNTGFSSDSTQQIQIGANSPLFFVNKYGVGVNGVKANSTYSFNSKGSANISGNLKVGETINASNIQVNGNNVYHTGKKPSASDVGALGKTEKAVSSSTVILDDKNGEICVGFGDNATEEATNVQIKSSWGVGFSPMVDGQYVAKDKNAVWINTRNGAVGMKGNLTLSPDGRTGIIGATGDGVFIQNNNSGTALRIKDDKELNYNGHQVLHRGWSGVIDKIAVRATNLNNITDSGWYKWGSDSTGVPTTYGALFHIQWDGTDCYQIAMGSNGAFFIRCRVNQVWKAWKTISGAY